MAATEPALTRWTFRIGDALPEFDPKARFITVVAAALNDLLFVNRLLLQDPCETTPEERQYLIRTAIGHLWELSLALNGWLKQDAVQELVKGMPDSARADLETVVSIATPRDDTVAKTIAHLRNVATWHYATPEKARPIVQALVAAADMEGVVEHGETMGTIRALFADVVILQISTQLFSDHDSDMAIATIYQRVAQQMTAAIRVAEHLVAAYFDGLPPGTINFGSGRS